jgi:hypothetical protein
MAKKLSMKYYIFETKFEPADLNRHHKSRPQKEYS